jgi:hypothetical protein
MKCCDGKTAFRLISMLGLGSTMTLHSSIPAFLRSGKAMAWEQVLEWKQIP